MKTDQEKKVILAATDFSEIGDYAIDNAAGIARIVGGELLILHVLNKETRRALKKQKREVDYLHEQLAAAAEKARLDHGIATNHLLKEGSIFTTIADVAREYKAIYAVLGTHGKRGIQHLMGSLILKVIKKLPVPVFSVQKSFENNRLQQIVFPLETSLGSKQKIKWAVHLNKFTGSTFHFFLENPGMQNLKIKLRADLNQLRKIMDQHGIKYNVEHAKEKGDYSRQTIEFARQMQADCIMVSTDPDKITWALFGSTDEKIIYNKEKIPVMCMNARDLNVIIGGL